MFKRPIAFCLMISVTLQAYGVEGILIQSPQADSSRFEGYVKSKSSVIKFSDHFLNSNPSLDRIRQLQNRFTTANKSFLEGSLMKAKTDFELVTLESRAADWDLSQRALIHLAYLRLAQLTEEPVARTGLLKEAIEFDPRLRPDPVLIPPPLVSEYATLLKSFRDALREWDISDFSKDFDYILVNGQIYNLRKGTKIMIGQSRYRVTLLSDVFSPVTRILTSEQILALVPSGIPMAQGACDDPDGETSEHLPERFSVYFPEDCFARYEEGKWKQVNAAKRPVASTASPPPILQLSTPHLGPKEKTNWLAVGLISIAVGVLVFSIAKNQSEKTGPTPTHE